MQNTLRQTAARPTNGPTLLRRALLLDAAASGGLGLIAAIAAAALAEPFDLPSGLLRGAGVALVPFAALLAYLGSRERVSHPAARSVVAVNLLWVVGSLLMLIAGWVDPSALGVAFVLVQALAVALFAGLQELGLRRTRPTAP